MLTGKSDQGENRPHINLLDGLLDELGDGRKKLKQNRKLLRKIRPPPEGGERRRKTAPAEALPGNRPMRILNSPSTISKFSLGKFRFLPRRFPISPWTNSKFSLDEFGIRLGRIQTRLGENSAVRPAKARIIVGLAVIMTIFPPEAVYKHPFRPGGRGPAAGPRGRQPPIRGPDPG